MSAGERDCGTDAAAYVLGALEPGEAEAFRRHMSTCSVCQDEVAAFGQVADALHLAVPQLRAPRGLRRRVLRAVRAEPQPPAPDRGATIRTRGRFALQLPRAVVASGLAVAVAAVLAATVFSGGEQSRVIRASVIGSPGSAELRLSGGRAELILSGFPQPPAGDVYEVWLKRPGRPPAPTSALFSVTSRGTGDVGVPGDLDGVRQVLVTPEPDGGSAAPSHAPVIVAQLS